MLNQYKILLKPQNLLKPPRECTGFPGGSDSKKSAYNWETWVWSLGWEDPLEKEMATPSSILTWRIPWTEEPGVMQSQRVTHNIRTNTFIFFQGMYAQYKD